MLLLPCSHCIRMPDRRRFREGEFTLTHRFSPSQGSHHKATTVKLWHIRKTEKTRSRAGWNSESLPLWPTCVYHASCSKVPGSPKIASPSGDLVFRHMRLWQAFHIQTVTAVLAGLRGSRMAEQGQAAF